jgi:hypothetical protein
MAKRAIVYAAMILQPRGVRGVLMQTLRRHLVVLAADHAAKAREERLGLIGANAVVP